MPRVSAAARSAVSHCQKSAKTASSLSESSGDQVMNGRVAGCRAHRGEGVGRPGEEGAPQVDAGLDVLHVDVASGDGDEPDDEEHERDADQPQGEYRYAGADVAVDHGSDAGRFQAGWGHCQRPIKGC